jgi:hypothetical protein
MTTTETILLQVALSLMVAALTAFLTVWLGLRRFYREKWWEAKMRSYTDIIQALHHMNRDLEISIAAAYEDRDTESDYHKEWEAKHRAAWDEIRKQVDIGEFLFSAESIEVLKMLISETKTDPNDMYVDHLEQLQTGVEKCMPAIKVAARRDLGLPTFKAKFRNLPTTSILPLLTL